MSQARADDASPAGVLRLTWVRDNLAHVLEHSDSDEPTGTWTGLACTDFGLGLGADVALDTLTDMCARGDVADLIWEAPPDLAAAHRRCLDAAMSAYQAQDAATAERHWQDLQATWSHAWAANLHAMDLMQQAGITRFAPFKPQRWVIASFEHHCGPHGAQQPHVHNIVVTPLTRSMPDQRRTGRSAGR